jgi:hypothetical protein
MYYYNIVKNVLGTHATDCLVNELINTKTKGKLRLKKGIFKIRVGKFYDSHLATLEIRDSAGDHRADGCAASREMRNTCVAIGIRNHPRERIADRHGAYRPALPNYRLPLSRDPSPSREIEVIIRP